MFFHGATKKAGCDPPETAICMWKGSALSKKAVASLAPAVLLFFCATVSYSSKPLEIVIFGPVTVVAPREEKSADPSASRTVITIKNEPSETLSVAKIIEGVAGINIKEYGGLGDFAVAMIRGSSPGQVAVYLDGALISSGKSGVVNLADIPVSSIERIEIYKGMTPPAFAFSGMGGVINLVSRNERRKGVSAKTSYGSFNTISAVADISKPSGVWNFYLHADAQKSDGDFEYENNYGTPYNESDDVTEKRRNNFVKRYGATAKASVDLGKFSVTISDSYFDKTKGLAGIGVYQSENAQYRSARNMAKLDFDFDLADDISPHLDIYHTYTAERFYDPAGEIGLGIQDNEGVSETLGASFGADIAFSKKYTATLSLSLFDETFNESDALKADSEFPERKRIGYSVAVAGKVEAGATQFFPSIRYERRENEFGGEVFFSETEIAPSDSSIDENFSPRLGATYGYSSALVFRASVGKYFRAPEMTELFGDRGVVVGNSDLLPESGINYEVGFTSSPQAAEGAGALSIDSALFYRTAKDLIAFSQNSQRTSIAQNIGEAKIYGAEISATWLGRDKSFSANYTFQRAEDLSDIPYYRANILPNRPIHAFFARAGVKQGAFSYFADANVTGETWLDRANTILAPSRALFAAGCDYRFYRDRGKATFEIKNIYGNQVVDAIGYPLPGRSYYLTVAYSFSREKQDAPKPLQE